jgi:hypothetical protein
LIHFSPLEAFKEEKPKEVVEEKPQEGVVEATPKEVVEGKPQEGVVEETPKEGIVGIEVKKEEPPQIGQKTEATAETKPMEEKPEVSPKVESTGVLSGADFRGIGIILDSKEGKQLMSQGDIVYLAFKKTKPIIIGDKYTVFRTSDALRHPVTGQKIGKKYDILGNIQVIDQKGNFFMGEVIESFDAILKGDMLRPYVK